MKLKGACLIVLLALASCSVEPKGSRADQLQHDLDDAKETLANSGPWPTDLYEREYDRCIEKEHRPKDECDENKAKSLADKREYQRNWIDRIRILTEQLKQAREEEYRQKKPGS